MVPPLLLICSRQRPLCCASCYTPPSSASNGSSRIVQTRVAIEETNIAIRARRAVLECARLAHSRGLFAVVFGRNRRRRGVEIVAGSRVSRRAGGQVQLACV